MSFLVHTKVGILCELTKFRAIKVQSLLTSPPGPLSCGEGEARQTKDHAFICRSPLSCGEGTGERSKEYKLFKSEMNPKMQNFYDEARYKTDMKTIFIIRKI